MTEPTLRVRPAARVVLLDPDDRVLLMRYDDAPPNGSHWSTPGGGLNDGEDYPAAALRELAEETGWSDVTLSGEVARRSFDMAYGDQMVHQVERLYLARTRPAPSADPRRRGHARLRRDRGLALVDVIPEKSTLPQTLAIILADAGLPASEDLAAR